VFSPRNYHRSRLYTSGLRDVKAIALLESGAFYLILSILFHHFLFRCQVRYHLYVDCVPINARTVAPLEAPQLNALVERAASVPGPMGGRKLAQFLSLVSALQGECCDGHTACMNGVAFKANAVGHRGVLMDLALPPQPPPPKPPRKGTIADLPLEYKGKSDAEAKFRAKAAVTNATVGASLVLPIVFKEVAMRCFSGVMLAHFFCHLQ